MYETHFWHLTKVRPLTNVSLLIRIRGRGGGPNKPADTTDYHASRWGMGVCFYSADSTKLCRGNQDATRTGKTLSLEPNENTHCSSFALCLSEFSTEVTERKTAQRNSALKLTTIGFRVCEVCQTVSDWI